MSQDLCGFYKTINGFKFPASFSPETIEFALNYKPKSTDLLIVTYPKCGTTWTEQIINLLLNNGKPHEKAIELITNSYIEMRGSACLNSPLNPRVIKTHLSFDLMPYNKDSKYLCVLRNPKDACVSFYYYLKKIFTNKYDFDFHQFFIQWIDGLVPYGDYFQHTLTLWSHRFDGNFTFLVYEQMKSNTRDAVLKIGQFLGDEYVVKMKDNNELLIDKVIEYSTVDYMKPALNFNPLVRKGIVGDWKSHFDENESKRVDEKVKEVFTGTGLEVLWAEDMKW